jgi:hypothetical protein
MFHCENLIVSRVAVCHHALQNVSTGSTGGSSYRGLVIWVQIRPQLVARHLTSHRSLERDDQVGWNALVAVNALPDAWLACIAASS